MRTLFVATVAAGLLLGQGAALAAQDATPPASPAACAVTTEAENQAIANVWHEEAINNGNLEALRDVVAPDVVHHAAGGYPDVTNIEGVMSMMGAFPAAFSDLHYTVDFWVVQDDMVVERYTATGTQDGPLGDMPATGREATWTGVNIFRIECGKIAEVWSEVDALSRNAQLFPEGEAEATLVAGS
ncbi:MAG: ester cyclase [Thermomicrobiales bacterium]|nr:ester cyclase [Thermomicrobiales bacterium]